MRLLRLVKVVMDPLDNVMVSYDDMTHEVASVQAMEGSDVVKIYEVGNPLKPFWVGMMALPETVRREIAQGFKGRVE